MNASLAALTAYLKAEAYHRGSPSAPGSVLTISREAGSGGSEIAALAGKMLSERTGEPWLVVDQNLAERIARDHRLPARIRRFLGEEQSSPADDFVGELIGLHPARAVLVHKAIETILHLAGIGRVVFVGRAAHVVLSGFPGARHVRIIGSLERRADRISALNVLSPGEARTRARQLDDARARFVERFFHRDIADPVGYDLVLNTDRLSLAKAARLAAALVAGPSRGAATGGTPSPTKERQSPALRLG